MPIDPNISSGLQYPQINNPMDTMNNILQLQNLLQTKESNALVLEKNKMELEQMKQGIAANIEFMKMADTASSMDELAQMAYQAFGPQTGSALVKQFAEAEMARNNLNESDYETGQIANKELGTKSLYFLSLPDNQKPAAWESWLMELGQKGGMWSQLADKLPKQYPGDEITQSYIQLSDLRDKWNERQDQAKKDAQQAEQDAAEAAAKPPESKQIVMPDGSTHWMGWNPDTQQYDKDLGISKSKEETQSANKMDRNQAITILSDPKSTDEQKTMATNWINNSIQADLKKQRLENSLSLGKSSGLSEQASKTLETIMNSDNVQSHTDAVNALNDAYKSGMITDAEVQKARSIINSVFIVDSALERLINALAPGLEVTQGLEGEE